MLSLLLDFILAVLLFRKRTPATVIVGITIMVLIVLVVAVVKQAQYVN